MKGKIAGIIISALALLALVSPFAQAQGEQLTITLYYPLDGTITSDSSIEVSGAVSGYSGLPSELRVTVSSPVSTTTVTVDEYGIFLTTVELKDGTKLITIQAVDAQGNSASTSVVVTKTTSTQAVPSQQYLNLEQITIPENVFLEALLEFTGAGRCRLVMKGAGKNPLFKEAAQPQSSSSPTSIGWDVTITASSSEIGKLRLTASGWVAIPLTAEQKQMVSTAIFTYKLSPQTYNQRIIDTLESRLNIDVTSLNISRLDFDSGASKLTFAGEIEIQSAKIDASVIKELPFYLTTNGSGSFPSGFQNFTETSYLNAFLKAASASNSAVMQINLNGGSVQASLELEFQLKSDPLGVVMRSDNEVVINFGALRDRVPSFSVQASDRVDVTFTIKVPPNTQVEGLPPGHESLDGGWVWRRKNAVDAISSLIRGEHGTVIRYPILPAAVTIQDIQDKVGQTISIENNYVKNVFVESATKATINFQETYEIRRVKVSFASVAQSPRVVVRVLPERPSEVEAPRERRIHYYFTVDEPTSAGVAGASIEFKVSKLWIAAQDADPSTVKLLRYSNGWQELKTEKSEEDENYLYFSAELPSFSLFAVSALPTQPTGLFPSLYIVVGAIVVFLIVILVVIWRHISRIPKTAR
ncbi:MAG: PGF-pre-PGF domain-containing protein [Candidatus Hadarchaeales archaeon]